jgi:hypothetical protein
MWGKYMLQRILRMVLNCYIPSLVGVLPMTYKTGFGLNDCIY